jgi:hypothetical protein
MAVFKTSEEAFENRGYYKAVSLILDYVTDLNNNSRNIPDGIRTRSSVGPAGDDGDDDTKSGYAY